MEDCLDAVGNAKYLSKLDLTKGYYSVMLTERAKEISAFVTPFGQYQYKRMPFGLMNAPATFQRLMNRVLGNLDGCRVYLDDIIIFTHTWEEHREKLAEVLERLRKAGLTPNLAKCEFGKTHVVYLGHEIGQGRVKPIQAKIEAINRFPVPTGKREVRSFLGMVNYYRRYCTNFAKVAEPLTNTLREGQRFKWTEACQEAFEELKGLLRRAPVLLTPVLTKAFSLATDASDVSVGAVLMQTNEQDVEHPIAYMSKS